VNLCYCTLFYLGQCSVLLVSLSCPTACLLAFKLFIIGQIKMDGWMDVTVQVCKLDMPCTGKLKIIFECRTCDVRVLFDFNTVS